MTRAGVRIQWQTWFRRQASVFAFEGPSEIIGIMEKGLKGRKREDSGGRKGDRPRLWGRKSVQWAIGQLHWRQQRQVWRSLPPSPPPSAFSRHLFFSRRLIFHLSGCQLPGFPSAIATDHRQNAFFLQTKHAVCLGMEFGSPDCLRGSLFSRLEPFSLGVLWTPSRRLSLIADPCRNNSTPTGPQQLWSHYQLPSSTTGFQHSKDSFMSRPSAAPGTLVFLPLSSVFHGAPSLQTRHHLPGMRRHTLDSLPHWLPHSALCSSLSCHK